MIPGTVQHAKMVAAKTHGRNPPPHPSLSRQGRGFLFSFPGSSLGTQVVRALARTSLSTLSEDAIASLGRESLPAGVPRLEPGNEKKRDICVERTSDAVACREAK